MDCFCTCRTGKCKAHLCVASQRCCNPPRKPCLTVPIADCNGRLYCPTNCQFPWSNYLKENWIQPSTCTCTNTCGMKHLPSNTKNLPRFFKANSSVRHSSMLHCDDTGKAVWQSKSGQSKPGHVTSNDEMVCQVLHKLRLKSTPIIWIYGHAHKHAEMTRKRFCIDLASALGFFLIDFDAEILYWTDKLFHRSSKMEMNLLPPHTKRLATMCIHLMGDEELHLNLAGYIELVKLLMMGIQAQNEENNQPPPRGLIFEGFPSKEDEAKAFESAIQSMSLGIYFSCRAWSKDKSVEPEVSHPRYFRRDTPYSEVDVERVVDKYGSKSIKILNMEDFQEYEADHVIKVVKNKLGLSSKIGGGGDNKESQKKCGNPHCDCLRNPFHNEMMEAEAHNPVVIVAPLLPPSNNDTNTVRKLNNITKCLDKEFNEQNEMDCGDVIKELQLHNVDSRPLPTTLRSQLESIDDPYASNPTELQYDNESGEFDPNDEEGQVLYADPEYPDECEETGEFENFLNEEPWYDEPPEPSVVQTKPKKRPAKPKTVSPPPVRTPAPAPPPRKAPPPPRKEIKKPAPPPPPKEIKKPAPPPPPKEIKKPAPPPPPPKEIKKPVPPPPPPKEIKKPAAPPPPPPPKVKSVSKPKIKTPEVPRTVTRTLIPEKEPNPPKSIETVVMAVPVAQTTPPVSPVRRKSQSPTPKRKPSVAPAPVVRSLPQLPKKQKSGVSTAWANPKMFGQELFMLDVQQKTGTEKMKKAALLEQTDLPEPQFEKADKDLQIQSNRQKLLTLPVSSKRPNDTGELLRTYY